MHIRDLRHAKRVVQACRELAFTFSIDSPLISLSFSLDVMVMIEIRIIATSHIFVPFILLFLLTGPPILAIAILRASLL